MKHRLLWCARAVVCAVLVSSVDAFASPSDASKADDYGYKFTDDPLQAGGFGATDPRIVVAPHAMRQTLIRPRTAFIVEMLKSVEAL